MLAVAAAPADQRERLSQAVAAVYASDGGWADGSGVDPTGGAPVPRTTVATASGGVSKQGDGKRHGKGPEQTTCVHPPGVEGVARDERAPGRP
jgi:hypothetical protein